MSIAELNQRDTCGEPGLGIGMWASGPGLGVGEGGMKMDLGPRDVEPQGPGSGVRVPVMKAGTPQPSM